MKRDCPGVSEFGMGKALHSMWPRSGTCLARSQCGTAYGSSSAFVHVSQRRGVSEPGARFPSVGCLEETCPLAEQSGMSADQHGKVNQSLRICSEFIVIG